MTQSNTASLANPAGPNRQRIGTPDFPLSEIRDSFPSLESTDEGRRRIYFDNPAGTQVPRQVIDAVTDAYLRHNGNGGS